MRSADVECRVGALDQGHHRHAQDLLVEYKNDTNGVGSADAGASNWFPGPTLEILKYYFLDLGKGRLRRRRFRQLTPQKLQILKLGRVPFVKRRIFRTGPVLDLHRDFARAVPEPS